MKTKSWVIVVLVLIIACLLWWYYNQTPVAVNCGQGDSLADKIRQNPQARKFLVSGKCEEQKAITITNDNVTIQGEGRDKTFITGTATKPVITVDGARGVEILDLTVEDGEHGILVLGSRKRGAEVKINGVNAQGNEKTGLCVLGPEPLEKPSRKTPPYQSKQEFSESGDRCVASLEPSEEPIDQAPQSQKEPLSSSTIWNALIRNAAAQSPVGTTSAELCDDEFHDHSVAGIYVGPQFPPGNLTLIVSDVGRCHLESHHNGHGLLVQANSTVEAQNSEIVLENNTFGLRLLNSSATLSSNSEIRSNNNRFNISVDSQSTVECKDTSSIPGSSIPGC